MIDGFSTGRRAIALNGRQPWLRTLATEVDTRANDVAFEAALNERAGLAPTSEKQAGSKDVSLAQLGRRKAKKDSVVDAYLTFKHMRRSLHCSKYITVG